MAGIFTSNTKTPEEIIKELTAAILARPLGALREAAAQSVPLLLAACARHGVDDPGQIAYILATAEHESGLGRYMHEIWGPTELQARYEGRWDLGNSEPGDGYLFRGRGYVQITGRVNYRFWTRQLKLDLVGNPELAADPATAAEIAVRGMKEGSFTTWKLRDYINGEQRDFVKARKIINGMYRAGLVAAAATNYLAVLLKYD